MRTIIKEKTVFTFGELSEDAKEKAIEEYRCNMVFTDYIINEAHDTFLKFAEIFNISWSNMDYSEGCRSEFSVNLDDHILCLSGLRLQKYIWNNFKNELFKGKYFGCVENDKKYSHPRIKSKELTNIGRLKNWFNPYYSAITLDNSCVLTGVCYDDSILAPIYDFLNETPNDRIDFETLLNDCINSLLSDTGNEIEYQYTDEAIIESIEANGYEFEEDGTF